MVTRPCLEPGCGRLIAVPTGSRTRRCQTHERATDRARGTTTDRGYGTAHQRLRAHLVATSKPTDPCWRCGQPLGPDPTKLHLGHTDDRTGYMGLEHIECSCGHRRPDGRTHPAR